MRTTDQRLTITQAIHLPPGGRTEIITTAAASTWAERSGDGRTIRYVRQVGDRQTVFATVTP